MERPSESRGAESFEIRDRLGFLQSRLALAEFASAEDPSQEQTRAADFAAEKLLYSLLSPRGSKAPPLYAKWDYWAEEGGYALGTPFPDYPQGGYAEAQDTVRERWVRRPRAKQLPYALYPELYAIGTRLGYQGLPESAWRDPIAAAFEGSGLDWKRADAASVRSALHRALVSDRLPQWMDSGSVRDGLVQDLGREYQARLEQDASERTPRGVSARLFLQLRALLTLCSASPKNLDGERELVERFLNSRDTWFKTRAALDEYTDGDGVPPQSGGGENEDEETTTVIHDALAALRSEDELLAELWDFLANESDTPTQLKDQHPAFLEYLHGLGERSGGGDSWARRVAARKDYDRLRKAALNAYVPHLAQAAGRGNQELFESYMPWRGGFPAEGCVALMATVHATDAEGRRGLAVVGAYLTEQRDGVVKAYPHVVAFGAFHSPDEFQAVLDRAHRRVPAAPILIADVNPHLTKQAAKAMGGETPSDWPYQELLIRNPWGAALQYDLDVVNEGGKKNHHGLLAQVLGLAQAAGAKASIVQDVLRDVFHADHGAEDATDLVAGVRAFAWSQTCTSATDLLLQWAEAATTIAGWTRDKPVRQHLRNTTPLRTLIDLALSEHAANGAASPQQLDARFRAALVADALADGALQARAGVPWPAVPTGK